MTSLDSEKRRITISDDVGAKDVREREYTRGREGERERSLFEISGKENEDGV